MRKNRFPGGNSKSMYESLFSKLLKLNDNVEVYPGHDYGLKPSSTIGEEKKSNYTLQPRSLKDFIGVHESALTAMSRFLLLGIKAIMTKNTKNNKTIGKISG